MPLHPETEKFLSSIVDELVSAVKDREQAQAKAVFRLLNYCPVGDESQGCTEGYAEGCAELDSAQR